MALQTFAELPPLLDPLEPARVGGVPEIDRALARLSTHQRLLVVAAHPDDEDTTLLAYVARARGGEAAYLSLSRGDGGQNLIGEELGEALGLLRSRELQEARRIDGARQFFSRAYDFGYTRSLDEALARWPLDALVADALRVVQRFKPQVMVAVFPPDERAGHGQHQASAVVAGLAFDSARVGAGWRPSSFYRAAFFSRGDEPATVSLPLGRVEPFSGKSIFQLAMASRSQHRCQDMGLLQPIGDAEGRLAWVAGAGETSDELFGGIDTSLSALADPLADAGLRKRLAVELDRVQTTAEAARASLAAVSFERGGRSEVARSLLDIVHRLESAAAMLGHGTDDVRVVRELVDEKLAIARQALAVASGLAVEAFTEQETIVAGQAVDVHVQVWSAFGTAAEVESVQLVAEDGTAWQVAAESDPEPSRSVFRTSLQHHRVLEVQVPDDAAITVPYYLRQPRDGDLFDWRDVPETVRGEPFGPAALHARFHLRLADGSGLRLERDVVYRERDQARGEVRRPLRVVPAVEVSLSDDLRVWSWTDHPGSDPGVVILTLQAFTAEDLSGQVEVRFPAAGVPWGPHQNHPVHLEPGGRTQLRVQLPTPAAPGRYGVEASFVHGDRRWSGSLRLIDYPHVDPVAQPVPATFDLVAADLALPDVRRIGYVRGASDRVPEMLLELGLPVEILGAEQLADADLSVYDVVVVGSRAYEVAPALARANARLLDYAAAGGLVVVQYQQYQFVQGGFAPYPLDISRPHDRVTDETSPVTVLEPSHPIFTMPNLLGDADWQGWVQERGLYFAGTWDDAYTPLLAMADPGRDETRGALLVAEVGSGRWIYTGLAFFRQLPAGVPGAYRLFMNLLSPGTSVETTSNE